MAKKINIDSLIDAIDVIRPALQNDGGDIEFVSFDEEKKAVYVKLVGACFGCPMSTMTLTYGVQRYLRDAFKDQELVVVDTSPVSEEMVW